LLERVVVDGMLVEVEVLEDIGLLLVLPVVERLRNLL
jgi:hypothetical protein